MINYRVVDSGPQTERSLIVDGAYIFPVYSTGHAGDIARDTIKVTAVSVALKNSAGCWSDKPDAANAGLRPLLCGSIKTTHTPHMVVLSKPMMCIDCVDVVYSSSSAVPPSGHSKSAENRGTFHTQMGLTNRPSKTDAISREHAPLDGQYPPRNPGGKEASACFRTRTKVFPVKSRHIAKWSSQGFGA